MLQAAGLSLVLALAAASSVDAASSVAALAPGPAACKNLTTYLGSKVDSNPVDPAFLNSKFGYWNSMQSVYQPSCVVYPTSAQDVSVAIQGIRAAGSRFAIKAGGHNPNTFFSSVDKGVLIDLGSMTAKSYDASTTLGTYQPGGVFGDVYNYFSQYGRTVVGARLAGVGTGLALGGGLSYLSGQYGMACDSFRELEVVLPSGQIVTASPTQNSDLFFADKGGGGNAYGVVTKYTVQTRPSGTFYAGNIVYALTQINPVLQATKDFIQYNTDPKAAIITTYEILGIPGTLPGLNTNEAVLLFLVYDGPDSGTAFQNFTKIPYLINTLRQQPYTQVVNNPFPYSTIASRGANTFRVGVHRATDQSAENALAGLRAWAKANVGSFELVSLDYEPVPKSLTDASKAQGGNAMLMPDGPWFWVNYLLTTPPTLTSAQYSAVQASFAQMVRNAGNEPGLPLFINDANVDQNPLSTYGGYSQLQAAKAKYDPDGFFSSKTGGWTFS